MKKIAVFLSGTGRTLENLIKWLPPDIVISLVVSDRADVRGNHIARHYDIPLEPYIIQGWISTLETCRQRGIDLICLAGFLQRIDVTEYWQNKILNIHPSLLPAFGGKGMYGHRVHEAVLARGCKVSGCTVHYVDNEYDHGKIIAQEVVPIYSNDTPDTLATRVFERECYLYPEVIKDYFSQKQSN